MSETRFQKSLVFQTRICHAIKIQIQCVTPVCPEACGIEALLISVGGNVDRKKGSKAELGFQLGDRLCMLGLRHARDVEQLPLNRREMLKAGKRQ